MSKRICIALVALIMVLLCGCKQETAQPAPTPPDHEVDVLKLDTPTPIPTPEQEQVTVYSSLDNASLFLRYSQQYVQPVLAIHGGWNEAVGISADELGRFYIAMGDERRGYSIADYLTAGEYRIPAERFIVTLSGCFELSSDYLMSLPAYDAENDCFVIQDEPMEQSFAEVYRVEEREEELHIRYILYTRAEGGYYVSTGSRYELLVEMTDGSTRYISSTPMTDDQPLPAPQNGQSYINTEIADIYARRELVVEDTTSVGDISLVKFSGAWSGLELFDRPSGKITPVVCFAQGKELCSPPFDEYNKYPTLGAYTLEEDGSVWMTVYGFLDREGDETGILDPIYTFRDGKFTFEQYKKPLGNRSYLGERRVGTSPGLYAMVPGEDKIAFIFDNTSRCPMTSTYMLDGQFTIAIENLSLDEDFELPASSSSNYTITLVEDENQVLIRLKLSDRVRRYRLVEHHYIAGDMPYIELELITEKVDYPEGW